MGPRTLKAISMALRVLQLIFALFIVGVASFHTYQFSKECLRLTDGAPGQLPRALYAILAISCLAAIYSFLTLLTTCLGHRKFFLFAVLFDLLSTGGFVAISVLMRGSTKQQCRGIKYSGNTSISTNNIPSSLYGPSTTNSSNVRAASSPHLLCYLDKAVFSLAVVLSVFFPITLFLSHLALKAYRKHRAFGPSPANNYSIRNGTYKPWANPFHQASEETAHTSNTAITKTTAGGYDAPGFRGTSTDAAFMRTPIPAMAETTSTYRIPTAGLRDSGYRAPALTISELGEADNGRLDLNSPLTDHRYKGRW